MCYIINIMSILCHVVINSIANVIYTCIMCEEVMYGCALFTTLSLIPLLPTGSPWKYISTAQQDSVHFYYKRNKLCRAVCVKVQHLYKIECFLPKTWMITGIELFEFF